MSAAGEVVPARRAVSLAHLTLIDQPPPALVRVAAEAGYDAVGLRVVPVTDGPDHTLPPGSPRLRQTVRALRETGLRVLDVEVARIRPDTDVGTYEGLLDAAAELGARYAVVIVEDADHGRAADSFAAFCALAAPRRVTAMVEFMVFKAIRTLADATRLLTDAGAANAGVLVDPLHLARSGGTVDDVGRLPARLVPYLQFCDAASAGPAGDLDAAGVEARRTRLPPGDGALPLAGLLAATPPDAALSLEVPDGWHHPDPVGRARLVRRSVDRLLPP